MAVHVFVRTPMLFTKPPTRKGAVHKIARPEKKVAIFGPLKMDGWADGNQKNAFPKALYKREMPNTQQHLVVKETHTNGDTGRR